MLSRKLWPALLVLAACNPAPKPLALPASGFYVGLESMGPSHADITPEDTTDRWYHENRLTIRSDSVFLEKLPVVIKNHQKGYSASDGGFYTYRGRISAYPDSLVARLRLVNQDYMLVNFRFLRPPGKDSTRSLAELVERGIAEVDSSQFKATYHLTAAPGRIVLDSVAYAQKK
ncbi:hypothetical protein LJY25_10775 [Hymenobacter sp. BT175]|uniref:hypothetical protein n=1 Tax=Hymenobacter translucens TaxID=2886507 RepID=UPI001D0E3055|nr:hypothetical protein [Hymenobacter translucens]MCC2546929.1 hypothetical protein [Hymenobacter translucens]